MKKIIVGLFYTLAGICCQFLFHVIQKYHRSKAPGLQSIHGKVLCEVVLPFMRVIAVIKQLGKVVFEALLQSLTMTLPVGLVMSIHVVEFIGICGFHLALQTLMIVKYLSIYKSSLMENLDETRMIPRIQGSIVAISCSLAPMEYNFWTNITDVLTFQSKYTGNL